MRRGLAAVAAVLLLTGCSVLAPSTSSVKANSPSLAQLKASAHIQDCPATSAPATGNLPNATLQCLGGGRSVPLQKLRGPMLINVWATYCGSCREEMTHIQAFSQKYAGRVAVLGDDYFETSPAAALEFVKSVGATYPQMFDPNQVMHYSGYLPVTVLIDAKGKIVYKQAVAFASEAQIEQTVQKYLGVRP